MSGRKASPDTRVATAVILLLGSGICTGLLLGASLFAGRAWLGSPWLWLPAVVFGATGIYGVRDIGNIDRGR